MIEYFSTGGTATVGGVFIPASDLAGIIPGEGEFDTANTGLLEGKFTYGYLNALITAIANNSPLGFTASKSGAGTSLLNTYRENCAFTNQWIVDYALNSIYPAPLATVGTAAGLSGLSLETVFPNCSLKLAGASCSGEGALFPHEWAVSHGGSIPAATDDDARDWLQGSIAALCAKLTLRSTTTASAITTATNMSRIRTTGASIPDAYTAPYPINNPTSGLNAADLPHLRLIQEALSIEYEFTINPNTQTLEVRVATT